MKRPAIVVDRIAKHYRIPHPRAPRIADYLRRPAWARRQPRALDVAALNGVTFDVQEGEVFGIIGRNGAGKSTLLKILSRITTPTSGRAEIAGRVASLLEVGTGFHPDLTGRENVYLNGMLLGMSSRAVDQAFDDICEFAGIGAYIDTPIKRYSSGMQLRLAFAVAAHLAADTMIVDEVLAVGDAEFQAKCTTAMRDAAGRGRTTLFVSHNMAAVENLCTRVVWLERGRIVEIGSPEDVVRRYLAGATEGHAESGQYRAGHQGAGLAVHVRRAAVTGGHGASVVQGDDVLVQAEVAVQQPVRGLVISIGLSTIEGTLLTTMSNRDYRDEWNVTPGFYDIEIRLRDVRLMPRAHSITIRTASAFGADVFEHLQDVLTFHVQERDVLGRGMPLLADRGVTWYPADFRIEPSSP